MRTLLAASLLVLVPLSGSADTLYVPGDYGTIQDALNAAFHGDTIIVGPGTYAENIDFLGKAVTLTSSTGPAVTVIDGSLSGSVVIFISGEGADSVLEGFTITNGSGTFIPDSPFSHVGGGGIYCAGSSPTLRNNLITWNRVAAGGSHSGEGGGVCCYDASPAIKDNIISENNVAGLYGFGGALFIENGSPQLAGNTVSNNAATGTAYTCGGGMFVRNASPVITENTITGNHFGAIDLGEGGGISIEGASAPTLTGNTISHNTASYCGGGIYCNWGASGIISGNTISMNTLAGDEMNSYGGGIYCCNGSAPVIACNTISNNEALATGFYSSYGGGIYCGYGDPQITQNLLEWNHCKQAGGGIHLREASPLVAGNVIRGNDGGQHGGGVYCYDASPTIENNILTLNSVHYGGGGIFTRDDSAPTIRNNLLASNTVDRFGGGMYLSEFAASMTNNTLFDNSAGEKGGGIYLTYFTDLDAHNMVIWDNHCHDGPEIYVQGSTTYPSILTISHSDVRNGQASVVVDPGCTLNWGTGMIDADPGFVDPGVRDLHLEHPSPCRDTGNSAAPGLPAEDFEGDPRVAGGAPDMGADECHRHLYCTGDFTPGGAVQVKLVGLPGTAQVGLVIGFQVFDPPLPGAYGKWYMKPPMIIIPALGSIPATGVYILSGSLPGVPPGPYTLYLQAMIGYQLTNLCILEVK